MISWNQVVPSGKDEKALFEQLGARIASLRRMPVSSLPVIARFLGISIEELIGEPPNAAAKKRGPTPKIQQQVERIQRLPRAQQRLVMQMIDGILLGQSNR